MITPDTEWNPKIEARYLRLAGPFLPEEEGVFSALVSYLQKSGARILTVQERDGANVWRLRSECETREETAARLHRKP
jgi:hypothetical protein